MKSTQTTIKKSQHERLQDEYIEYRRYGEYGDTCNGNYCNQCLYLGSEDCRICNDKKLKTKLHKLVNIKLTS